eukprot:COSAG02_NODE_53760_length_299_cov_140.150000_1_plen_72_part_01
MLAKFAEPVPPSRSNSIVMWAGAFRGRGANLGLDRRGDGENSPRQRNLTLSLPKIWCEDSKTNLTSKRCRML